MKKTEIRVKFDDENEKPFYIIGKIMRELRRNGIVEEEIEQFK